MSLSVPRLRSAMHWQNIKVHKNSSCLQTLSRVRLIEAPLRLLIPMRGKVTAECLSGFANSKGSIFDVLVMCCSMAQCSITREQ